MPTYLFYLRLYFIDLGEQKEGFGNLAVGVKDLTARRARRAQLKQLMTLKKQRPQTLLLNLRQTVEPKMRKRQRQKMRQRHT